MSRAQQLKEVKLRPNTDAADLDRKAGDVQKFLEDGSRVRISVRFRGRETLHPNLGRRILDGIMTRCAAADVNFSISTPMSMEGRTMALTLAPKRR